MKLLDIKKLETNNDIPNNNSIWSRELQIQFAYTLINVQSNGSRVILRQILNNLIIYEKLMEFELVFLNDLWMKAGMIFMFLF